MAENSLGDVLLASKRCALPLRESMIRTHVAYYFVQ
jgi:hypothetical protein